MTPASNSAREMSFLGASARACGCGVACPQVLPLGAAAGWGAGVAAAP